MQTGPQVESLPSTPILDPKKGKSIPWWGWVLILLAVIGAAVGIYFAVNSPKDKITPTPFSPTPFLPISMMPSYTNMTTSRKPT